MANFNDILTFWFDELGPAGWWSRDDEVDAQIASRFSATHAAALRCELYSWRITARGRLAEVIVLDQFSRNLHRDSPLAFAADPLALALAQEAVLRGVDRELNPDECSFIYMPYMHSESVHIHEAAVQLFTELELDSSLDFELRHKKIIDQFGRYPHRNAVLGRKSSAEELAFLQTDGSSF